MIAITARQRPRLQSLGMAIPKLAFGLKIKRVSQQAAFFFLAMLLAGLVKPADGQTNDGPITPLGPMAFPKRSGVAKAADAQTNNVPITIGPITLGKPWPTLEVCPTSGWENTAADIGICRDGDIVWHVPYHGASLMVRITASAAQTGQAAVTTPTLEDETTVRESAMAFQKEMIRLTTETTNTRNMIRAQARNPNAAMPENTPVSEGLVGFVYGEVSEKMCDAVFDRLKTKFGVPVTRAAERMNRFGARWTMTEYLWLQTNGDQIALVRHLEMSDCWLDAETAEHKRATAKPEVRF